MSWLLTWHVFDILVERVGNMYCVWVMDYSWINIWSITDLIRSFHVMLCLWPFIGLLSFSRWNRAVTHALWKWWELLPRLWVVADERGQEEEPKYHTYRYEVQCNWICLHSNQQLLKEKFTWECNAKKLRSNLISVSITAQRLPLLKLLTTMSIYQPHLFILITSNNSYMITLLNDQDADLIMFLSHKKHSQT